MPIGTQDVNTTLSTHIDNTGTFDIDTWYSKAPTTATRRLWVTIANNGVNNDMATGILYLTFRNDATTETAAATAENVLVMNAGDSRTFPCDNTIYVNIQADTANMRIYIEELDSPVHRSTWDTSA